VQAEDRLGRRIVQFALGRTFLGRLEDELDRSRNLLAHVGEHFGRAHQDGDVSVVAAGVHDRNLLPVELTHGLRSERHARLLGHR